MLDVRDAALPQGPRCAVGMLVIAGTALLAGLLTAGSAFATNGATYAWERYDKRIAASQKVTPLGPDLLGDRVSLSNGNLSFEVTDVSLPGNNDLPVAFTRGYEVIN